MTEATMTRETRRAFRRRIRALAEADWNALDSEVCNTEHARRTLAEMPAARRAMLEAEWSDPVADYRRI